MSDPSSEAVAAVTCALIITAVLIIFCSISWLSGYSAATKDIRYEAIQAGAAEWVPGEDGEATFTWRGEDQ